MRKLALALALLPAAACYSFGWEHKNRAASEDQKERGIKDVATLVNEYNSQQFFRDVRRRSDGRNNAFGRDLMAIQDFFDRHIWNYNANDPSVNYPSNTTKLEHMGRFGLVTITSLPFVDEITNR
jgi:hypothetical protein